MVEYIYLYIILSRVSLRWTFDYVIEMENLICSRDELINCYLCKLNKSHNPSDVANNRLSIEEETIEYHPPRLPSGHRILLQGSVKDVKQFCTGACEWSEDSEKCEVANSKTHKGSILQ